MVNLLNFILYFWQNHFLGVLKAPVRRRQASCVRGSLSHLPQAVLHLQTTTALKSRHYLAQKKKKLQLSPQHLQVVRVLWNTKKSVLQINSRLLKNSVYCCWELQTSSLWATRSTQEVRNQAKVWFLPSWRLVLKHPQSMCVTPAKESDSSGFA